MYEFCICVDDGIQNFFIKFLELIIKTSILSLHTYITIIQMTILSLKPSEMLLFPTSSITFIAHDQFLYRFCYVLRVNKIFVDLYEQTLNNVQVPNQSKSFSFGVFIIMDCNIFSVDQQL